MHGVPSSHVPSAVGSQAAKTWSRAASSGGGGEQEPPSFAWDATDSMLSGGSSVHSPDEVVIGSSSPPHPLLPYTENSHCASASPSQAHSHAL